MSFFKRLCIFSCCLTTSLMMGVVSGTNISNTIPFQNTMIVSAATAHIEYKGHIQDIGDVSMVKDGAVLGTTGRSLRLEELSIRLSGISGGISITPHLQDYGWLQARSACSGSFCTVGSRGESRRLEAVKINLTGQAANEYDIRYTVHVEDYGWMGWVNNGGVAGTTGESKRIEAIQIQLIPKTSKPVVYQQKSGSWSNYNYGYYYNSQGKKVNATIGSSGCGVVSLTNAIQNLNGTFVNPTLIAEYSLKNGYRVNNVGTSYDLYKSFCDNRGSNYGIKFIKKTSSYSDLSSYLSNGNVAIIHVPGHIMACTAYSSGKFLVIDSQASSSRGTESGYAWKTENQMRNMGVVSDFYIIGRR